MAKKQTAVEWLYSELHKNNISNDSIKSRIYKESEIWKQAKAMEKEQMDKVSEDWFVEGCSHMKDNKRIYQSFEQYYNETYG
jgi:hypothetical protein